MTDKPPGLFIAATVHHQAKPGTHEATMVVLETDAAGKPTIWCDPEIADLVRALNVGGLRTVASCSGHGEQKFGIVTLKDGRELLVMPDYETTRKAERILGAALAEQQPAVVRGVVQEVIEALLQVAYRAWCMAEDTEDGPHGLIVARPDFDALSAELDKLDALPDDQPGYTMEAAAKARWALRHVLVAEVSARVSELFVIADAVESVSVSGIDSMGQKRVQALAERIRVAARASARALLGDEV